MDNTNNKKRSLTGEFPSVSTREWEEKIKEDLRGGDYEKNLVWETNDGYRIRPYYRREDLRGIGYLESQAQQFPWLRGGTKEDNSWLIHQDIQVKDAAGANKQAREIASRGVTSLGFDLSAQDHPGAKIVHGLLEGLPLDEIPVNFISGSGFLEILQALHSFALENNIDPAKIRGSLSFDPLGRLTATGNYMKEMLTDFTELGNCFEFVVNSLPGFKVINVSADVFHNAGASITQELAFALSMANEYLVKLTGMNFRLKDLLRHMQFRFSVGSSYFMEIAKLRAARFLWSRILQAYSPDAEGCPAMFIHSSTSRWNQTLYDPHVNMLRGTTASMSAILGGVDSLRVTEFDSPFKPPSPFSSRIARNTQIILREESYLDKVIDPAAGSYYIESLTDTLINGTWELFLKTEEKGGYIKSLIGGIIQNQVNATAAGRLNKLATRKEMLLGTNQYPIPDETAAADPGVESPAAGMKDSGMKDSGPQEPGSFGAQAEEERIVAPLPPMRGAQEFEKLRLKTGKANKQPVVFIIPLGNLAMRRARAMFTMNFFGCAGFRVIDNIGMFSTVEEGVSAARKAKADIVVLCSSDDEYPELATGFAENAREDILPVIAGYPEAHIDALRNAGILHFIHVRSNILAELGNYQKLLGI